MLKRILEIEKELDGSVFLFGARLSLNLRLHGLILFILSIQRAARCPLTLRPDVF